jgi:hypothetical protein
VTPATAECIRPTSVLHDTLPWRLGPRTPRAEPGVASDVSGIDQVTGRNSSANTEKVGTSFAGRVGAWRIVRSSCSNCSAPAALNRAVDQFVEDAEGVSRRSPPASIFSIACRTAMNQEINSRASGESRRRTTSLDKASWTSRGSRVTE